jgi:hypothetical protein
MGDKGRGNAGKTGMGRSISTHIVQSSDLFRQTSQVTHQLGVRIFL